MSAPLAVDGSPMANAVLLAKAARLFVLIGAVLRATLFLYWLLCELSRCLQRCLQRRSGSPWVAPSAVPGAVSSAVPRPQVEEEPSQVKGEPPRALCCPITLELLRDPVRTVYGHVFERRVLQAWLMRSPSTCPNTRRPLTMDNTSPAPDVAAAIVLWKKGERNRKRRARRRRERDARQCLIK